MKIITKNAVYVQKNDLAYLNRTNLSIQASIFMKIYGNDILIIDDSNRFEFEKFEDDSEISFFSELDWIIDYNSVKDLSYDEFVEMGQSIAQSRNQIAQQFNSMSEDERKKNFGMVTQCELLDFKIHSLRDILWFKQGYLKMTLPEDFDYPEGFVSKKSIKKLIKSFFNKKRN